MKRVKQAQDPTGALAPVLSWRPFWQPMWQLQEDIDRLFGKPFGGWLAPTRGLFEGWVPAVDVYEDEDNVFVKAEIPGMKKEEIAVYLSEGMLNIVGERKKEAEFKGAESYRSEGYFGRFHRCVSLPAEVEVGKVEAAYTDGVLMVTCPKTTEAKRKKVEIKIE